MGPRTTALVLLLLLAPAGAGCLNASQETSQPGPGTGEQAPEETPERLELASCREQIGIFHIERGAAEPYLPEGFEPLAPTPPEVYGGTDPSEATATLLLIGFTCEAPAGTALLFPYIPVQPPTDQQLEGAYYHAIALPCVADEASADLLAGWQVPCSTGEVTIQPVADTEAAALWELEAQASGSSVTITGDAPASRTEAGPELVRAFHAVDRQVCAVLDVRVEIHEHWQMGSATLEVTGSPAFPVPEGPGLSSLGRPGFALNMTHLPDAAGLSTPSDPARCR